MPGRPDQPLEQSAESSEVAVADVDAHADKDHGKPISCQADDGGGGDVDLPPSISLLARILSKDELTA